MMNNNIGGVKVTSTIVWLAALAVAFVAVLIGLLAIESKHTSGPANAVHWYMLFVGGILLLAGMLTTLLEIIMASPLHRVMRSVIVLIVGLCLVLRDGTAVLALVAALAVEAYLLRNGIGNMPASAKQDPPAPAAPAAPPPPPQQCKNNKPQCQPQPKQNHN